MLLQSKKENTLKEPVQFDNVKRTKFREEDSDNMKTVVETLKKYSSY